MSLAYLGPIKLQLHGNPAFRWTSAADPSGMRDGEFSGVAEWPIIHQLSELTENPHRKITYGRATGVLEVVWADDSLLSPLNGWWLFASFDASPDQRSSVTGLVSWSLSAVRLPPRPVAIVDASRARVNAHGVTPRALVADPFGDGFQVPPAGTLFQRAYDPRGDVDPTDPDDLVIPEPRMLDIYRRSL